MERMLKSDLIKKVKELEDEINSYEHLAAAIEDKDKELAELRKTKEVEVEKACERTVRTYKARLEHADSLLERRTIELNKYVRAHGNLLKILQGVLDNSLELNEFLYNEVTK